MKFIEYKQYVSQIIVGKKLPTATYLHESALNTIPKALSLHIIETIENLNLTKIQWNIIKLYKNDYKVSLLHYPDFDTYAYPALMKSTTIDIETATFTNSKYEKSENPPILHRKETFVKDDYPHKALFIEITKEGEAINLYEKPRSIGFKKSWERLIKKRGYILNELGRLKELIVEPPKEINRKFNGTVERHKTAINRHQLSQPVSLLARHNYLNGDYSIFDFGCGKGDDVRELEAHGLNVNKWDPISYPEEDKLKSDIVNLGFVINVIEDKEERINTLKEAWHLANKILVASVMIAGDAMINQFTPYKDGVLTKINTFQKYYSQSEIRYYIDSTLNKKSIPVGQGIFYIFKDKLEEQTFLLERQYISRNWQQKTIRELQTRPKAIKKSIIEKNIELFSDYWKTTLDLGRIPANNEFEFSEQIRKISGSHMKAHSSLIDFFGGKVFKEATTKRRDDLLVYFALSLFDKRRPQTQMPERLKRDIKVFFNSYTDAVEEATEILYSVSNTDIIEAACQSAYKILDSGLMEEDHSYTFHKKYIGECPKELRIYIGCATQLYGNLDDIQLVKAHITSGKVSLMGYDNWNKKEPLLLERIKIKMREQDVDFFDYIGEFTPTPLTNKNIY